MYLSDVWVGYKVGQESHTNMDFIKLVGMRMDLADGILCLPDEVRIVLVDRRPPYRSKIQAVNMNDPSVAIYFGKSTEVNIGIIPAHIKS